LYGYSWFSNEVAILAAQVPDKPQAPTTTFDAANDDVILTWVAPDNAGSEILTYTIQVRHSDGTTFSEQL